MPSPEFTKQTRRPTMTDRHSRIGKSRQPGQRTGGKRRRGTPETRSPRRHHWPKPSAWQSSRSRCLAHAGAIKTLAVVNPAETSFKTEGEISRTTDRPPPRVDLPPLSGCNLLPLRPAQAVGGSGLWATGQVKMTDDEGQTASILFFVFFFLSCCFFFCSCCSFSCPASRSFCCCSFSCSSSFSAQTASIFFVFYIVSASTF